MCATCGCSADSVVVRLIGADEPSAGPDHRHGYEDGHDHGHSAGSDDGHGPGSGHRHGTDDGHGHEAESPPATATAGRTVLLQHKVLAKNDDIASSNRDWLRQRDVHMLNLMSSPGAGKTTLLETTARDLAGRLRFAVIEGDQETALDAGRIEAAGCRVVQINTGVGCHLDAGMVARGLQVLDPPTGSMVVIENVGNLVCPAMFDLGEAARVVLASVPEGADKPVKYPHMFRQADLILLTKSDLLPYVNFDLARYMVDVRRVSPGAQLMRLSAVTGEGIQDWYDWLIARIQ
jgi:hydrogenase nickel incorporation protein HypB